MPTRRVLKSWLRNKVCRPLFEALGIGWLSSTALDQLDLQIASILGHSRGGFFVEAGANDGVTQSNTYYLEKLLGWKGILVEASPDLADKCTRARPRSTVINAALVRSDYPRKTVKLEQAGLMSVVNDGTLEESFVQTHVAAGLRNQKLRPTPAIEVAAAPLSKILEDERVLVVDLLSLDVEGYELEALRGIDFEAVKIHRALIEVRPENESDIDEFLGTRGFTWERVWRNRSYANKLYRHLDVPLDA